MSVCCECCVLSGRGLCDELITRPEESYRLCCVAVCNLETSWKRRPWPTGVLLWQKKLIKYLRLRWRNGNYKLNIRNKEQIGNVLACNVPMRRVCVAIVSVGKAINITSLRMCVCILVLVMRHAKCILSASYFIAIYSLPRSTIFFRVISLTERFPEKFVERKMCFGFHYNFRPKRFLF